VGHSITPALPGQAYNAVVPQADELPGQVSHIVEVGRGQRLRFAAAGLAAGDSALLALLLFMRLPEWGIFLLYVTFSVLGWILVGVPIAMAVPVRLLRRLTWPIRLLVGAAIGPLALLVIFVAPFAVAGRIR
jgi:hypothetical protein